MVLQIVRHPWLIYFKGVMKPLAKHVYSLLYLMDLQIFWASSGNSASFGANWLSTSGSSKLNLGEQKRHFFVTRKMFVQQLHKKDQRSNMWITTWVAGGSPLAFRPVGPWRPWPLSFSKGLLIEDLQQIACCSFRFLDIYRYFSVFCGE